jgi:hypothetical protein
MDNHVFTLDNIDYHMAPANAGAAWEALKRSAMIFSEIKGGDQSEMMGSIIGSFLAHVNSPELKALENIIYSNTSVLLENGKMGRLSDNFDNHFNAHRGHIINVLIEGFKYQFSPFLSGIIGNLTQSSMVASMMQNIGKNS